MEQFSDLDVDVDGSELCLTVLLAETVPIEFQSERFAVWVWLQFQTRGWAKVVYGLLVYDALQSYLALRNGVARPPVVIGKAQYCADNGLLSSVAINVSLKMNGDAHL
jgi:hypothetical protein